MGSIAKAALDMSGLRERTREARIEAEGLVEAHKEVARTSSRSGGGGGGGGSLRVVEQQGTPLVGDIHARNLLLGNNRTNQLLEQVVQNTGGGGGGGDGGASDRLKR